MKRKILNLAIIVLVLSALSIGFVGCSKADKNDIQNNKNEMAEEKSPWDQSGAKQPEDYTWAEFEALTGPQQIAFQNELGADGFENWMNEAQGMTEENPWDKENAKQPKEYTWAEFEALTGPQQIAFQNELGESGFGSWLEANQP